MAENNTKFVISRGIAVLPRSQLLTHSSVISGTLPCQTWFNPAFNKILPEFSSGVHQDTEPFQLEVEEDLEQTVMRNLEETDKLI